jgi:hypothetical protein
VQLLHEGIKEEIPMNFSYWLFMFDFALAFYVLGATFIEGFVNYRTWHWIGAAEFRAFHQAVGHASWPSWSLPTA